MNPDELFRRYQELQQYVGWTADDARRVQPSPACWSRTCGLSSTISTRRSNAIPSAEGHHRRAAADRAAQGDAA